ncbi:MAG: YceI family protein [SAR324 cluster bacterium]|nr:YceI family protein [SAR324 cluster bacterium]
MKPLLVISILIFVFCPEAKATGDKETYHILQKGFITIEGKTNFFDFKGRARKHQGKLEEENDKYSGEIKLQFSDLDFNLVGVGAVLEEKNYINSKQYPIVNIHLNDFVPGDKPTKVKSMLTLRGVEKPIVVDTIFNYLSPVVKVEGTFVIKQSEFGIKPYKKGFMKTQDDLHINFKVFFCEIHKKGGNYHKKDKDVFKKLLKEEKITILNKAGFFGCSELEKSDQ